MVEFYIIDSSTMTVVFTDNLEYNSSNVFNTLINYKTNKLI